jgi:hypothetical protein
MKLEPIQQKLKEIERQLLTMIEYHSTKSHLSFFIDFEKISKLKTLLVRVRLAIELIERNENHTEATTYVNLNTKSERTNYDQNN